MSIHIHLVKTRDRKSRDADPIPEILRISKILELNYTRSDLERIAKTSSPGKLESLLKELQRRLKSYQEDRKSSKRS